ncbi:DUF6279 family lipoprotein [Inhella sp.]|uniref:DUF6279 family lipoprotein n=1 Tax=Inhella sp. TaxID=1921806 RepID=UPI0035B2A54A
MPSLPRLSAFLACLLVAGCSSLTLGYGQLPRLMNWWIGGYLDFDRAQGRQLDTALRQWHDWHRREELAQWQALLAQADALLDGGLDEPELLRLEKSFDDSLRRCLERAAPLAQPLLASLSEMQWAQLRRRMAEKQQEWREREDERDDEERGDRYVKVLERWLGELPPAAERLARQQAAQWPRGDVALWHERRDAQQRTLDGLRAWAAGDLAGGTRLLLAASARDASARGPAGAAMRQRSLANLAALTRVIEPGLARRQWARWQADMQQLRNGS